MGYCLLGIAWINPSVFGWARDYGSGIRHTNWIAGTDFLIQDSMSHMQFDLILFGVKRWIAK